MANSLDQIAAINTAEMGPQKAQCVHAVAVLLVTALTVDKKHAEAIIGAAGVLALALGIKADQAMEVLQAGAADMTAGRVS